MATQADPRLNSGNHKAPPIRVTAPGADARRRELVAVTAYYLAERRAFAPGHEAEDWAAAEAMVRHDLDPARD